MRLRGEEQPICVYQTKMTKNVKKKSWEISKKDMYLPTEDGY